MVRGRPSMSYPRTTARSGRGTPTTAPGTDRHPSTSSSSRRPAGSRESRTGLTTCPTCRTPSSSGQSYTNSRRSTPTWFAASPAPSATYIVRNMSSMSAARSGPNSVTSRHGLCSTSSPTSVIRRTEPRRASGASGGYDSTGLPCTNTLGIAVSPCDCEDAVGGGTSGVPACRPPPYPPVLMTTEHPQQPQQTSGHTRRRFLTGAGAGGAAGALALWPAARASAAPSGTSSGKRVAVLGGGVSGLSAAHELAERGYAVTVYEYYDVLGGKARSMDVPGTASGGRRPLPGEHGFRFFPGFYRNLPDTMRRIPFPGSANGVHGNLRNATEELFARSSGRPDLHFPLRRATTPPAPGDITPSWIRDQILSVLDLGTRLPAHEAAYFADRLLVHLTSCDARREDQWEKTAWWDFIRAEEMSEEYRTLLGIGQTRNLVATRAEVASTRTVGRVIIEALILWGLLGRGLDGDADIDRVLNAPTSEAWIDPWERHLRSLGVEFVTGTQVREVLYADGRVTGVRVSARDGGQERTVTADHYVSAMPVEHARGTWGEALRAADPQLARCDALRTDWMTGVMFYLRTPTPVVHGHINCLDSPWSVTGI